MESLASEWVKQAFMLSKETDDENGPIKILYFYKQHFQKPLPTLFYRNWNIDRSSTSETSNIQPHSSELSFVFFIFYFVFLIEG